MRLSVVIPALNEERHLGQLLSDLQRQSRRPGEIIVVDAGSTDATVDIAKRSNAVVLHGEPPIARGMNIGGFSFLRVLQENQRADERTRTADLLIRSELFYR